MPVVGALNKPPDGARASALEAEAPNRPPAGAGVVVAAGAVVLAGAAPNNPPEAGAVVVAGAAPNKPVAGAAVAAGVPNKPVAGAGAPAAGAGALKLNDMVADVWLRFHGSFFGVVLFLLLLILVVTH